MELTGRLWCVMFIVILYSVCAAPGSSLDEIQKYINKEGDEVEVRISEELIDEAKHDDDDVEPPVGESKECASKCFCRSRYRHNEWYCCACSWTENICFPSTATVRLQNGDVIEMSDLKPGHNVLTALPNGELTFSEVRAFMKRNPDELGLYLKVSTTSGHVISLSQSHVIFMKKSNDSASMIPRYAQYLDIGDTIYVRGNGSVVGSIVTDLEKQVMEGVYVPLTEQGTILVDDVLTSCYASFDHDVAHVFMTPLRWWPWLLGNEDLIGMAPYVTLTKTIGRWILSSEVQDKKPKILGLLSGFANMFS